MRSTPAAQLISTLLLLIIMASYVMCPVICTAESASGLDRKVSSCQHPADHGDSSHGPDGVNPDGHDHNCVGCPMHAPLSVHFTLPVYAPCIAALAVSEPLCRLPEVYLSRFIPPQLAA